MLSGLQANVQKFVSDNATVLLTGGGVVGTIATGVLAWRGGYNTCLKHGERYGELVEMAETTLGRPIENSNEVQVVTTREKVIIALPDAVPPIVIGAGTIASIIFSHRMSAQKAAAMAALYGLSQNQFEDYKAKVQEKLTGQKAQAINDELAQDQVNKTPGSSQIVVVEGQVLCFDQATGRYFQSSMEAIRKAEINTNQEILHHDVASATFFYEQLGLPPTTWSEDVGWNSDNMVEIEYSTVLAYNDRPCITINFKYLPRPDYYRRYSE